MIWLKKSRRRFRNLCEENGRSYRWHLGQPPYLIKNGRKSSVTQTTTFPWLSWACKQPTVSPKALEDRNQTRAVGDHELHLETELPEWLQTIHGRIDKGIVKFHRRLSSRLGHTTAKSSSLSAHLPARRTSNKAGGMHDLFTYFPKDPNCDVCRRAKVTTVPCRINLDDRADRITRQKYLAIWKTADHKVLNKDQEARLHNQLAVVVLDLTTQWIQSYLYKIKSAQETPRSLRQFICPEENPRYINKRTFSGFFEACEWLIWKSWEIYTAKIRKKWSYRASCTTNERRHYVSGSVWTSRYLLNVPADGQTTSERRFISPFEGPIIPFGAEVKFCPISSTDQSWVDQFGTRVLLGNVHEIRLERGGGVGLVIYR